MLTQERCEELMWLWEHETSEEETQEWRDNLSDEEQELVDSWEGKFCSGLARLFQDMMGRS